MSELDAFTADMPNLPGAACAKSNPEYFFSFDPNKTAKARNICRRCPVIRDCLTWSLTHNEAGIWAATDEQQRDQLRTAYAITMTGAPA